MGIVQTEPAEKENDMRFPKAQEGVKLLFIAEIVGLIIGILGLSIASRAAMAFSDDGPLVFKALVIMLILMDGHLIVAFFILFFTGLNRARQDEPRFGHAMLCMILALVLAFVGAFAIAFVTVLAHNAPRTQTLLTSLLTSVTSAMSYVTMLLIASGVRNLAKKLGDSAMAAAGTRFQIWIAALCGSSIVLNLVRALLRYSGKTSAAGTWITMISFALSVVTYILTLIFLYKAKLMLSQ